MVVRAFTHLHDLFLCCKSMSFGAIALDSYRYARFQGRGRIAAHTEDCAIVEVHFNPHVDLFEG
jgi:hypothetical protein